MSTAHRSAFEWPKVSELPEWSYVQIDPTFSIQSNLLEDLRHVLNNRMTQAEKIHEKNLKNPDEHPDEEQSYHELKKLAEESFDDKPLDPLTMEKIREIEQKLKEFDKEVKKKDIEKAKKEAAEGKDQGHFKKNEDEL